MAWPNWCYLYYQVNIRDEKQIEACIKAVIDKFGRIDILINNARYMVGLRHASASVYRTASCIRVGLFQKTSLHGGALWSSYLSVAL